MSFTSLSSDNVLMDNQEFESPMYQRVYQYLRRHNKGQKLDKFLYTGKIEGTKEGSLQIILKYVNASPFYCTYFENMPLLNVNI